MRELTYRNAKWYVTLTCITYKIWLVKFTHTSWKRTNHFTTHSKLCFNILELFFSHCSQKCSLLTHRIFLYSETNAYSIVADVFVSVRFIWYLKPNKCRIIVRKLSKVTTGGYRSQDRLRHGRNTIIDLCYAPINVTPHLPQARQKVGISHPNMSQGRGILSILFHTDVWLVGDS